MIEDACQLFQNQRSEARWGGGRRYRVEEVRNKDREKVTGETSQERRFKIWHQDRHTGFIY